MGKFATNLTILINSIMILLTTINIIRMTTIIFVSESVCNAEKPLEELAIDVFLLIISFMGLIVVEQPKDRLLRWIYVVLLGLLLIGFSCTGFILFQGKYLFDKQQRSAGPGRLSFYKPSFIRYVNSDTGSKRFERCLIEMDLCMRLNHHGHTSTHPVKTGCCQPPKPEFCAASNNSTLMNPDCLKWSKSTDKTCFYCDSCKAANMILFLHRSHKRVLSALLYGFCMLLCIACGIEPPKTKNLRRPNNGYA